MAVMEKKIKVLLDFFQKIAGSRGSAPVAPRTARNSRWPQPAKHSIVPKRPSQRAQSPRRMPQGRRPHPITGGGRRPSCAHSPQCIRGCYPIQYIWPPPSTPTGGGGEGHGLWPGIAPSADDALDDREFRAVRGAGISPVATGDQRLCLWKPRFFEKNRVKLLIPSAVKLLTATA